MKYSLLVATSIWGICIGLNGCQSLASSSVEWLEITQESKPWIRWWWQGGTVSREGIRSELEAYQKAGLGGLELTSIYGIMREEDELKDYPCDNPRYHHRYHAILYTQSQIIGTVLMPMPEKY